MNSNSQDLQKTMESVLNSPEGKKLLKILRSDGGTAMAEATAALKKGLEQEAVNAMTPMLDNPEVRSLLQSLNKNLNHG